MLVSLRQILLINIGLSSWSFLAQQVEILEMVK